MPSDRSKLNYIYCSAKIANRCWKETQARAEENAGNTDELSYWIDRAATFEAAAKFLAHCIERHAEEARRVQD